MAKDSKDYSCDTCKDDPKSNLGSFHTSGENEDGSVTCFDCGQTSGGTSDSSDSSGGSGSSK